MGPASTASADSSPIISWSLSGQPTQVAGYSAMQIETGDIEHQVPNASSEKPSTDARWRSEVLPERTYEYTGGRDPQTGLARNRI